MKLRYATLLACLALFLVLGPPLAIAEHGALPIGAMLVGLIAAGGWAASNSRSTRLKMGILTTITMLFAVWNHLRPGRVEAFLGALNNMVLMTTCLILIVRHVVTRDRVTADTVLGGICGYMLIGAVFYFGFSAVEIVHRGSFQLQQGGLLADLGGEKRPLYQYFALLYYSYVTLSTAGYGDIIPSWPLAQSLSCIEALIGQSYMATLLAFLVGLYITHRVPAGVAGEPGSSPSSGWAIPVPPEDAASGPSGEDG